MSKISTTKQDFKNEHDKYKKVRYTNTYTLDIEYIICTLTSIQSRLDETPIFAGIYNDLATKEDDARYALCTKSQNCDNVVHVFFNSKKLETIKPLCSGLGDYLSVTSNYNKNIIKYLLFIADTYGEIKICEDCVKAIY